MSHTHGLSEICDLTCGAEYAQLNKRMNEIEKSIGDLSMKLWNNAREKLEKWRDEFHRMINDFYEEKCLQLREHCRMKMSNVNSEVEQIRRRISELLREEKNNENDIQLLISNIQHLKQKIHQIEEKDIQINIQSFVLNKNFISFENSISDHFDLSLLSSPCHTIHSSNEHSSSMASNDKYLLIDQYPNLYLLDRNLTIVNRYQWKSNYISAMSWSAVLNRFIIITSNKIYLLDENLQSIEQIRSIKGDKWCSCTSSNSSLYLTANERGNAIFQCNFSPTFQLIRQWKCSSSDEADQFISHLTYQHEKLALIVSYSSNRTANFILRSSTTFDLLWLYQLDINYKWCQTAIRSCS